MEHAEATGHRPDLDEQRPNEAGQQMRALMARVAQDRR